MQGGCHASAGSVHSTIMLKINILQSASTHSRWPAICHQVQSPFHQKRNQLPPNPKALLTKHLRRIRSPPAKLPSHPIMAFEGSSGNNSGRLLPLPHRVAPGHISRSSNHRLRCGRVKLIVFSTVTLAQGLIESRIRPDDRLLLFLMGRCTPCRIKSRPNA